MAYSKFTTSVSGYSADPALRPAFPNRADCASDDAYAEAASAWDAWGKTHWKSTRRAGICKPATCRAMAEKLGLTHSVTATASSFDGSGKGRHVHKPIDLS